MINCFFVTDLHGDIDRYQKLFASIEEELPNVLFLGGDISPPIFSKTQFADCGCSF